MYSTTNGQDYTNVLPNTPNYQCDTNGRPSLDQRFVLQGGHVKVEDTLPQ